MNDSRFSCVICSSRSPCGSEYAVLHTELMQRENGFSCGHSMSVISSGEPMFLAATVRLSYRREIRRRPFPKSLGA